MRTIPWKGWAIAAVGTIVAMGGPAARAEDEPTVEAIQKATRAVATDMKMTIENDEVRAGIIFIFNTKASEGVQTSKNKWECEKKADERAAHLDGSSTKIEHFCVWRGETIKTYQDSVWEETGFEKSFVSLNMNKASVSSLEFQYSEMFKIVRTDGKAKQDYETKWSRYSVDDARGLKFLNAVRTKLGLRTCDNKDELVCET